MVCPKSMTDDVKTNGTLFKIMAYLSFGLASWLFGDNLLAVNAAVPNSAFSLNSSHSEKTFGINGLVSQDIATHEALQVGSILMKLYEAAPTGASAGRPVPVVGEGASGRYDTAAVFIPPFPGHPEGRLLLADQAGTKYVFDMEDVREVWHTVANEVTGDEGTVEETQETPETGTDQSGDAEDPETEDDSASGTDTETEDSTTDETGQDTDSPDPETPDPETDAEYDDAGGDADAEIRETTPTPTPIRNKRWKLPRKAWKGPRTTRPTCRSNRVNHRNSERMRRYIPGGSRHCISGKRSRA